MPISAIAEVIQQPVFEAILHVFGYLTGFVVVPVFSLGMFQVERIAEKERRRGSPEPKDTRSDSNVPRVISADAATCCGLFFWVFAGAATYLIKYHT